MTAPSTTPSTTQSQPEPTSPGTSADAVVWAITGGVVSLAWLIATSWRPWRLFARAGYSTDFYDEQARAFWRGDLAVDPAVAGPEGFVVDGATYLYFGPFLALVRMPVVLFGDALVGRTNVLSMLVAFVVLCRWSARLARAARRVVATGDVAAGDSAPGRDQSTAEQDDRWPIGMFVAAVAVSPALYAPGWVSVYHETELWACALAIVTVTLVAEWAAAGFVDQRQLALAGVAASATTLTRAPIGLGAALAIGACGLVLVVRRDPRGRRAGGAAIVAGMVPLAAHVAVNVAKFGTLLSVPGDRQVFSLQSPARAAWFEGNGGSFFSPNFLPTTLAQYWRPDAIRFERLLPIIRFGPPAPDYGSYPVETVQPSASIPVAASALLVLAIVGVVWLVRRWALTWSLLFVATAIGALPTFLIGFVAHRYLIDLVPPLAVAGAIGTWVVAPMTGRRAGRAVAVGLVVWGAWVNAAFATWTAELKSPGFTQLRYAVDDVVFGGDPPGLSTLDAGGAVPADGRVALDPDCAGVYIAEQGHWVALERAAGVRRVAGRVPGAPEPVVVAATGTWSLEIARGAARLFDPAGAVLVERPVEPADHYRFEVVTDPVTGETFARIDARVILLPPGTVTAPLGLPAGDADPHPLCTELTRRR